MGRPISDISEHSISTEKAILHKMSAINIFSSSPLAQTTLSNLLGAAD
jgi:hypothetical protein